MRRAAGRGHELGPLRVALAAAAGWADLWESHCLYCGARLVVYRGQMSASQSDDALRQPLTQELIVAHHLPPHEPKHRDSRTRAFIERHGVACVEVDALPPAVLAEVVNDGIADCVEDTYAWNSAECQEEFDRDVLQSCAREQGPVVDHDALADEEDL
jgi:hypothetical protein